MIIFIEPRVLFNEIQTYWQTVTFWRTVGVLLLYNGPRRWGDGDGAREPAQQGRERGDIVKLEDSQPEITLDFLQHKDLI